MRRHVIEHAYSGGGARFPPSTVVPQPLEQGIYSYQI